MLIVAIIFKPEKKWLWNLSLFEMKCAWLRVFEAPRFRILTFLWKIEDMTGLGFCWLLWQKCISKVINLLAMKIWFLCRHQFVIWRKTCHRIMAFVSFVTFEIVNYFLRLMLSSRSAETCLSFRLPEMKGKNRKFLRVALTLLFSHNAALDTSAFDWMLQIILAHVHFRTHLRLSCN